MRDISAAFAATALHNHTAVILVEVIQNDKIVAILEVIAGSVSADRTAAQMRTMQFEIIDRDGTLTPSGMSSLLAPFGTRVQISRGVRINNVLILEAIYDVSHPWTPQTPTGVMNGTKIDGFGNLVLGP